MHDMYIHRQENKVACVPFFGWGALDWLASSQVGRVFFLGPSRRPLVLWSFLAGVWDLLALWRGFGRADVLDGWVHT